MAIPLVDLKRLHAQIRPELEAAFARALDNSNFILGQELEAFEKEFAAYCGARHAIGVGDGTDALFLALKAAGVGVGDEVITTGFTFVATAEAICQLGAKPVLVDASPDTCLMDVSQVKRRATKRTKALLPVHLYGQMCDMDELGRLAKELNLKLIEDACQAHGATYKGRRAGSLGDAACFSFFPSKNLGALGDGGMVTTDDDAVAARIRLLRDHGSRSKYEHVELGWNSRLDALQAAWLRVKLRHLDGWNRQRRQAARLYNELLRDLKGVVLPIEAPHREHIYHCYVVRVRSRDALLEYLRKQGIGVGIHYPVPLHAQPALAAENLGPLPVSEACAREALSLPMFPGITREEVEFVSKAVHNWAANAKPDPIQQLERDLA